MARPAAKVNLTLAIGPPEADGYHSLTSVFLRLGLADRLTASPGRSADDSLSVDGPPECPVEGNLVLKALTGLRRRVAHPLPGLKMALTKHIPLAAGLGGGSTDAAAALGLAEAFWGVRLSPRERLALAFRLGSDVPFFAADVPAALVRGRGQDVTALPGVAGGCGLLLVTPAIRMETGLVFARHDELADTRRRSSTPSESLTGELAKAFEAGVDGVALAQWAGRLRDANDLWPAACSLAPVLGHLRDALEEGTSKPWLLTGSGSALFAIYGSAAEAESGAMALSGKLTKRFPNVKLLVDDLQTSDPAWRYPS